MSDIAITLMNTFKINTDKDRDTVMQKVLEINKKQQLLPNLGPNCSYERGFELPLPKELKTKLHSIGLDPHNYMQYHNARQVRFVVKSGEITALRFKDSIRYWSTDELDKLENLLEQAHKELYNMNSII